MEPITLTAIAVFLAPYLQKAGEKVAEKTVETLFEARQDLAEKFTGLFQEEIISLGLQEANTPEALVRQLAAKPALQEDIRQKIAANPTLLEELAAAFRHGPGAQFGGITINAKNIGQVINNPTGPIHQTNTFS